MASAGEEGERGSVDLDPISVPVDRPEDILTEESGVSCQFSCSNGPPFLNGQRAGG